MARIEVLDEMNMPYGFTPPTKRGVESKCRGVPANRTVLVLGLSTLFFPISVPNLESAQITSPRKNSVQDAKASSGGTAINVGRDLTINYRDPDVQRILHLLEQQSADARRREQKYDERITSLERENQGLREEQAKAIAGVLEAARQPNPSPTATAARKSLQVGESGPSERYYREQEDAAVKAGREKLREAAEAARRQGSLAFLHDTRKALNAYRRAVDYEPDDVWSWFMLGDLQVRDGNTAAATESYNRAFRITEDRIKKDPNNIEWQTDLSVSHSRIGNILAAQANTGQAIDSYRRSLAVSEKLAAHDPNNSKWQHNLSVSHNKIGNMLAAQGNTRQAIDSYRKDLAISETLSAHDPNNSEWQRDVMVSHNMIGNMLAAQGNTGQAIDSYRRSFAISEKLTAGDPNSEWQRDHMVSHIKIGDILVAQGNTGQAIDSYRKSLAIAENLATRDPNNREWQTDLVKSIFRLTSVESAVFDNEAVKVLERAIGIVKSLRGEGKLLPNQLDWKKQLAERLNARKVR